MKIHIVMYNRHKNVYTTQLRAYSTGLASLDSRSTYDSALQLLRAL